MSILDSIKKMLGIASDYYEFDTDIIMDINSVFVILNQLGVGPDEYFSISGSSETWNDFFGDGPELNFIKTYMYLKVKLMFDSPSSSFVIESINNQIKELEWRINVCHNKKEDTSDG